MASHKLFMFVLLLVAVIVIYGSAVSTPIQEDRTLDLIDAEDYNFEKKLDDIFTEFHNLMSRSIDTQLDVEQTGDDINRIGDDIKDGQRHVDSVFDRIGLLEDQGIITGNIVGFDDYENSLGLYDQILLKSEVVNTNLQGYVEYTGFFLKYDEVSSEFVILRDILEQQLEEKRNEDAVITLNGMIDVVDKQIDLIQEQMNSEIITVTENELFLKDRTFYKHSLVSFRDDIEAFIVDPKMTQEEAFQKSDETYKEYIKNSFTTAQLRQAYDRWYEININGRFKELQELVVEFEASKSRVRLSG